MHLCNRVDRRSKSQNISELAFSLNRYHNSATPLFYSETQSDISFLIIHSKDSASFSSHQHLSQILWCDSCPRKAFRQSVSRIAQAPQLSYHEEKKFFPPEGKKKCCLVTCYQHEFCICPSFLTAPTYFPFKGPERMNRQG